MARYGRDYGGRGEEFAGRGQPGSWTHHGPGHGRGGWIEHDQDWRNNWNALAGGGERGGMGRGGYGEDYTRYFRGAGFGERYPRGGWRDYGQGYGFRGRGGPARGGGYGGDYGRGGRSRYDRGW